VDGGERFAGVQCRVAADQCGCRARAVVGGRLTAARGRWRQTAAEAGARGAWAPSDVTANVIHDDAAAAMTSESRRATEKRTRDRLQTVFASTRTADGESCELRDDGVQS